MSISLEDRQALLQQTIDLKSLQPYYHVDKIPARSPLLLIQNEIVGGGIRLSKFGQPVEVVERSEVKKRPHLEITKLAVSGDQVTVEFRYPPEGIAGTVRFNKVGAEWREKSHEIVER